jgi:hypothetical protein
MSDKLNPSTTAKVGGNNQAAANAANSQGENYPKEKPSPRHRKPKKWLGLTEAKRRDLLAIVMLIPWVWVDIIDCHNFLKLCLLAFSLGVAQFVSFSFFRNQWRGWALALWLISLIPVAAVVWINSQPEPKKIAKLSLALGTSGTATNVLWLTNDFLRSDPVNVVLSNTSPWVVVPILNTQTNVFLWLQLWNESSNVDAEETDVRVIIGRDVGCVPDADWTTVIDSHGQDDLTWRQSFLLGEGAEWLPKIKFPAAIPIDKVWGERFSMCVRVRAKNVPPYSVAFWVLFVSEETNSIKTLGAYSSKQIEFLGTNRIRLTFPK